MRRAEVNSTVISTFASERVGPVLTAVETPHTTAAEGHESLMLCLAMDHSAKIGKPVRLPLDPEVVDV